MTAEVLWDPEDARPLEAPRLEEEIRRVAPHAQVKLTFREGRWLVRALDPAAFCTRGPDFSRRDVSEAIAEALNESGCPASSRL